MMTLSEFYSDDKDKKAVITLDANTQTYWVDYYKEGKLLLSLPYVDKSIYYVEDAAENFCNGILNVPETA
jgi:antitoxin component YwqK of YwqJK toxin-antitoxin module